MVDEKDRIETIIEGKKGGGGDQRDPVIHPNSLQSNAIARIIDILGEGEIEGLVDGDKSIYINETQLQNDDDFPFTGEYNFDGVTTYFKEGTPDQTWIRGFSSSENEVNVNVEVSSVTGAITRTITDTDTDDIRIQMAIPAMYNANPNNGDRLRTSVKFRIYVNDIVAATITKRGKCVSEYRFSHRVSNLEGNYGAAPWTVKLEKITADGDDEFLANDIYWISYTEIVNEKFTYPNTSIVGFVADAKQFGRELPSRAYLVKGLKIKIPDTYDPIARTYSGVWSGTFQTAWTDNPAWVLYDLLTNKRYGVGISEDQIDKASFYTASQYNDEMINDGFGSTEPRFRFNYVIQQREEVYNVLSSVASCMMANLYWGTGKVFLVQDRDADPIKLVTNGNVIDGFFDYSTTSESDDIYTAINVTWNDPSDFYRPAVETVDADPEDILTYGRRVLDLTEIGCTHRGQAYRKGKWALESSLNQKEMVTYKTGWDHADVFPGDIIKVMDNNYANVSYGGRVVSATTNSLTLDREITIAAGTDYYVSVQASGGNVINDKLITTGSGTTETISVSGTFDYTVLPHSVFIITAAVEPRLFRVITNSESAPNEYTIVALYHDPNKYERVEEGKTFDEPLFTLYPSAGYLLPPTDLVIREYEYESGGLGNMDFGVELSWSNPDDPRIQQYRVQSRNISGGFLDEGTTAETFMDISPVTSGSYFYRVRSEGVAGVSVWLESELFTVLNAPSGTSDVTDLETINGSTTSTFDGRDCEFTWSYTRERGFKDYKVQIMKTDDTVLRTRYVDQPYYIYRYSENQEDNNGNPLRNFKIKVWTRNQYNFISPDGTALTVSNPAPDMSSTSPTITSLYNGFIVDWSAISPGDTDLSKYHIFVSESSPASASPLRTYKVDADTELIEVMGVDAETTYYIQVLPYDLFGVGLISDNTVGTASIIPRESIESELLERLTITDSVGTSATSATDAFLDGELVSGGVTYDSGDWIQYEFPLQQLQNGVFIWADKNIDCYVSYSNDESTWTYLKAEADHTLNDEGRLLTASSSGDAETNFWTAETSGSTIQYALFPNRLTAKYMRLHILTDDITIHELRFEDQVIAESILARNLAAINADLGAIQAGSLQSTTYTTSAGVRIDLDNETIRMGGYDTPNFFWDGPNGELEITAVVTFQSGSGGDGGSITNIDGGNIQTGTIDTDQLAADSITSAKIDAGAITATTVGTNEIIATAANIKDGVITNVKIADAEIDTAKIKNAAIETAKIANLNITTAKVASNAISQVQSAFTSGTVQVPDTNTWTTIQSDSITTAGGDLIILGCATLDYYGSEANSYGYFRFRRGSTTIGGSFTWGLPVWSGSLGNTWSFILKDAPSSGTYTYYFQAYTDSSGVDMDALNRSLVIMELKK